MKKVMDIHEVLKYLPHRQPFLLIDCVLQITEGESIIALKNVTINEPFFEGHFPGRPVMPGVLMIEAMAQAAVVLAKYSMKDFKEGSLFYFAGIDEARFRRIVEPGDQLRLEVKKLKQKRELWQLEGNAYVGDELACSSKFLSVLKGPES